MKPNKKKKEETTTVHRSTDSQMNHNEGGHHKARRPSPRSTLTKARAPTKNEHDSHHLEVQEQQELNTAPDWKTTTTRTTTAGTKKPGIPGAGVIAESQCRPKSSLKEGSKGMSTETLHRNTLRTSSSSSSVVSAARRTVSSSSGVGDESARTRAEATTESRVSLSGVEDSGYQEQQQRITQSLEVSSITPPLVGGLLSGSQSRLDGGLTPDMVRTLTSLVMNGTYGTTPSSQPPRQQPLLSGEAFVGALPVTRPAPPPELGGFQWNNLMHHPAVTSGPSSLSYQSLFGDIPQPPHSSTADALLHHQNLLSLIVRARGGHQAPQTNMNVPSTIWHQRRTTPQQDIRSHQLEALLQTVGSTTMMAQSNRWISDLVANSITTSDGVVPTLKQESQVGAVGHDHHDQLRNSNLDDTTTTDTISNKERNPTSSSSFLHHVRIASEHTREESESSNNVITPEYPPEATSSMTSRIVLPCGARGMPPEHNFQNAFLVIDPQTRHGDELMCSYRPCREGGVKFRYCSECRLPVAKRNFHQRHSHGLAARTDATAKTLPRSSKSLLHGGVESTLFKSANKSGGTTMPQQEDDHATSSGEEAATRTIMPHDMKRQDGDEEERSSVVDHCHPTENVGDKQPGQPQHNQQSKQRPRAAAATAGADGSPQTLANNVPAKTEELRLTSIMNATSRDETTLLVREREWAELLHRRPPSSDTDAISKWLFEVMSISEFPAPQEPPLSLGGDANKASSNVNNDDDSTTAMDRKTQRPLINYDDPNHDSSESIHDGDHEERSSTAGSVSVESPTCQQERHSAKFQKRHGGRPVLKDERPTAGIAKKRKR